MPDVPSQAVAAQRRDALMLAQQHIVDAKAEARVGTTARCLLEHQHPEYPEVWIGRTSHEAPEVDGCVYVENTQNAKAGDFISIEYTEPDGYDMIAVPSEEDS